MKNQSSTAIFALIIAIIALIIGWIAYNRTGEDLSEVIEREVREEFSDIREEYEEFEDDPQLEAQEAQAESNESDEVSYEGTVELDAETNPSQ